MNQISESPCRACKSRSLGCHSQCEAYKAYDAGNQQRRKENRMQLDANEQDAVWSHRAWKAMRAGKV
jgi:hypothetical protein